MSRARRLAEIAKANQPAFSSESAMDWWLADAAPKPEPPPPDLAKSVPPQAAAPPPEPPQAFAPPAEPLEAVELPAEPPQFFAPPAEPLQAVEPSLELLRAFAPPAEPSEAVAPAWETSEFTAPPAEPPQAVAPAWESTEFTAPPAEPPQAVTPAWESNESHESWESPELTAPHADPFPNAALPLGPRPSFSLFGSRYEAEARAEAADIIPETAAEPEPEAFPASSAVASTSMFLDGAFSGSAGVASDAQSEETLQDLASRLGSLREKFLALARKNQDEA